MSTMQPMPAAPSMPLHFESYPLTVSKIVVRVNPGAQIGTFYDGFLRVPQYHITWNQALVHAGTNFKQMVLDELSASGYNVIGGSSLLFDEGQRNYDARFIVGGYITRIRHDEYAPLAGNRVISDVTVQW